MQDASLSVNDFNVGLNLCTNVKIHLPEIASRKEDLNISKCGAIQGQVHK